MLTVTHVPASSPQTTREDVEVISAASDVATARAHLAGDLMISSTPEYRERVFEWFDTARDTLGMILNPDGSCDMWEWQANEDQLAA